MNIIKAAIIWFGLEFTTMIAWFYVWVNWRAPINDVVTVVNVQNATDAVNNLVTAANITFFAMAIAWTVWFAYAAHSKEKETSYAPGHYPPQGRFKGWKKW
jgi:hypothetical protein